MVSSGTITVAIVKSDAALGSNLKQVVEISANLRVVGLWTTGGEALREIGSLRPQVVLIDIDLPDISGIEVTARIKQRLPEIQVIMVTVNGDHNKVFAALRAGASGYFLRQSSAAEVHAAITDVLTSAEIARRVAEPFHQPTPGSADEFDLSNRESEVLERLSEGLGNKEIAFRLGISVETVRVHLRNIYKKIDVCTRTQAVLKFSTSCNPGNRVHPV